MQIKGNLTMKKITIITIAALILLSTATMAGQRDFAKLDTNGDKQLTLAEFLVKVKANRVAKMTKIFGNKDKNDDGYLTKDEFKYQGGV